MFRTIRRRVLPVSLLATMLIVACGSGGGEDSANAVDDDISLPPVVELPSPDENVNSVDTRPQPGEPGGPPAPHEHESSASSFEFTTQLVEGTFNKLSSSEVFVISENELLMEGQGLLILRNFESMLDRTVDQSSITVRNFLVDGLNEIEVDGIDRYGNNIYYSAIIWAGNNVANVTVVGPEGEALPAELKVRVGDDKNVGVDVTTADGTARLENLPSRTIIIEARTPNNFVGVGYFIGGLQTDITINVSGVGVPSDIDNNDFSQGLLGWEISGSGTVEIVPGDE